MSKQIQFEPKKVGLSIHQAPIIYIQNAFYLVGGNSYYDDGEFSDGETTIGRMDLNGQWTLAGDLNHTKQGHNVIFDGEFMMVFGGLFTGSSEKCLIENETVSCTSQNPDLPNHSFYPELFLVDDYYCK